MIINFGYVAMSVILEDCSPSKTTTVKNLSKIEGKAAKFRRLTSLARTNVENTRRLFIHNNAHDIKVFRLTSKLIPLATHSIAENWDWSKAVESELHHLGEYAQTHAFRLSAHPDHFTLLNSPSEEVTRASVRDLDYHHMIFSGMGLDSSAKLVIHVGGRYGCKEDALERFKQNYHSLPVHLKDRIILENDDKLYTAREVLSLCEELSIPMVLDIHHHWCNNEDDDIGDILPEIFATWKDESIPPKIHISSPKSEKQFRHHADYIETPFFLKFLEKAKKVDLDFDVMIEAKQKDAALFRLMDDLGRVPGITCIDQASIKV